MKKVVLSFILLVAIAVLVLWFFKAPAISIYLSKKLNASISVGGVEFSKTQMKLKNLKVRNPSGFKHNFAFTCNEALISYKIKEMKKNPSVIDKIDLNESNLYIDCKNALCTNNNWTEIMKDIASKEEKQGKGREVIVNNLSMNNLHVETEGLGLIPGLNKKVDIEFIDFGKVSSKEGFPTQQLIVAIFKEAGIFDYIKNIINGRKIFDNYFKAINPFSLNEEPSGENKEVDNTTTESDVTELDAVESL